MPVAGAVHRIKTEGTGLKIVNPLGKLAPKAGCG